MKNSRKIKLIDFLSECGWGLMQTIVYIVGFTLCFIWFGWKMVAVLFILEWAHNMSIIQYLTDNYYKKEEYSEWQK